MDHFSLVLSPRHLNKINRLKSKFHLITTKQDKKKIPDSIDASLRLRFSFKRSCKGFVLVSVFCILLLTNSCITFAFVPY